MAAHDPDAEAAIRDAAASVTTDIRDETLRYLVTRLHAEGRNEFYTLHVRDFLAVRSLGMAETVAVIRQLAAHGWIEITREAGVDAGYTHFSITEQGYKQGLPKAGRSLRASAFGSKLHALLFVGGIFGLGGGVLGLASIWSNITGHNWHDSMEPVLMAWENFVQRPVREVLSAPLALLNLPKLPHWVADYIGLGILVIAASLRASQFHDLNFESLSPNQSRARRPGPARTALTFIARNAVLALLWPWIVFYEIFVMGSLVLAYRTQPDKIDELTRTLMPPDKVLLRWIFFTATFVIFAALLIIDLLR